MHATIVLQLRDVKRGLIDRTGTTLKSPRGAGRVGIELDGVACLALDLARLATGTRGPCSTTSRWRVPRVEIEEGAGIPGPPMASPCLDGAPFKS